MAGSDHALPSCYFLLELAFVSSCDLMFESDSLVSAAPILRLAPGIFHLYWFHLGSTVTPSLCVISTGPGGLVCTTRRSLVALIQLYAKFYLSLVSDLSTALTLNKIRETLSNLQKKDGL